MAREIPQPVERTRRVGRATFLTLTAGTMALLFAKRNLPSIDIVPNFASADGFTIYTVTPGYPFASASRYRLRVGGMVAHPLEMTLADILRHRAVTVIDDYKCVTGWSVPHVRWSGIRLADLLDGVQPHSNAQGVKFSSFDGAYTESLTIEQARARNVLLAHTLNGKPLSRAHGAPLRLVVPGMYGYKYIKWLDTVELVAAPADGYWERRGYDRDAYIGKSNF